MLTPALTVTAFTLLATGVYGSDTEFKLNLKLETDCSGPKGKNHVEVIPDVSYPFRIDYLSLNECKAYEAVPCSPIVHDYCKLDDYGKTDHPSFRTFTKTYFELNCAGSDEAVDPGGWRSFVQAYTIKFSIISPKRALSMKLRERNDTKDPVHSDVFEPVRAQVIDITIEAGATTEVTSKIYHIGVLPSLVALHIDHGMNLSIRRHHFNRIPNVRLLVFRWSTIMEMEPYTFTDLPHLKTLSVDSGLYDVFREIDKHREWPGEKHFVGRWNDTDLALVDRIHCDCSFAWYRNFLESKPELIESKPDGATAVIGSYMSKYFFAQGFDPAVGSVDCARNLTKDNYHAGDQFSYNTTCFGPC